VRACNAVGLARGRIGLVYSVLIPVEYWWDSDPVAGRSVG